MKESADGESMISLDNMFQSRIVLTKNELKYVLDLEEIWIYAFELSVLPLFSLRCTLNGRITGATPLSIFQSNARRAFLRRNFLPVSDQKACERHCFLCESHY